jgi:sec-independent protein translocase protein TatA
MMIPLGLFGPLGVTELVVILLIVVLLFGARRIPDLARSLGEGIRNFRTGIKSADDGAEDDGADGSKNAD